MRIADLGLRPCLAERNVPLDTALDMKMMAKIEHEVALKQNLARRKKRLGAILQKIDLAGSNERLID